MPYAECRIRANYVIRHFVMAVDADQSADKIWIAVFLAILPCVTPASWLFIKGDQSIWIERPYGRSMIVAGPGPSREQHDFPTEEALEGYQIAIADKLATAGWLLWGVNRQRRAGPDRRKTSRNTPERRTAASDRDSLR
jgi:hypothetical protein